jgi:L-galactose dehydrogenase
MAAPTDTDHPKPDAGRVVSCVMQIARETIPALQQLKEQGLVKHIGITGLPLTVHRSILSLLDISAVDVCLSYCHYCLNDRSLMDLLPELESRRLGVINASCLSMGLLTADGPPDWHPAPAELKEAAAQAAASASSQGFDISRLALMWAVKVRLGFPSRPNVNPLVLFSLMGS